MVPTLTFSGDRKLINSFRCIKELPLKLCQLESSPLKLLILVRNSSAHKAKTRGGFSARTGCWLVSEVVFNERTKVFIVYQYRVLTDSRNPPLEHNLYKTIVLLIGWRGRLRQRKCRNDGLRIAMNYGLIKLLKFQVGPIHVPIRGASKIGKVGLWWSELGIYGCEHNLPEHQV